MANTKNEKTMKQLVKKVKLKVQIEVKTGLHIGAGNDKVQIGGLDNPVIRAVLHKNQPIIPGSSLKGKIRSLLEQARGENCWGHDNKKKEENEEKPNNRENYCPICQIFGSTQTGTNSNASRVIFRDLYLTEKSKDDLENANLDYPYTEIKNETAIDRITGTAKGGSLRNIERVPAGACFEGEIIVNIFIDTEKATDNTQEKQKEIKAEEEKIKKYLEAGFFLLNNDYLGGSGSRGYGQVELTVKKEEVKEYEIKYEKENANAGEKTKKENISWKEKGKENEKENSIWKTWKIV